MEDECLKDQLSLLLLKLETLFDMVKDPPITTLESLLQLGLLLGNLALFENLLWSAQFNVLKTSWLSNSRLHAEDITLPSLPIFLALEEQFWQYFEHLTTCTIVLFLLFVVTCLKQSALGPKSFCVWSWFSLEDSSRILHVLFFLKQFSFCNLFGLFISCKSKFEL